VNPNQEIEELPRFSKSGAIESARASAVDIYVNEFLLWIASVLRGGRNRQIVI
jgi:hypothetical protein